MKKIKFPLDLFDFFKVIFELEAREESFRENGLWKQDQPQKLAALSTQSKTILINRDLIKDLSLPNENKRFSLAHEGAHFIRSLQAGKPAEQPFFFRTRQLRRNKEETLVDYWAGALLMPKPELTDKLEKCSEQKINASFVADLSQIGKCLCKHFGVSRQALEIRLRQVGIRCLNILYGG